MITTDLAWWERERLFTPKDKEAIERARRSRWEDIKVDWAETEVGREEVRSIALREYHRAEGKAGML